MPASTTSPGDSNRQTGHPNKAERLLRLTEPYGPEFPLDPEIIEELEDYPGELPTSPEHFINLLPDPR